MAARLPSTHSQQDSAQDALQLLSVNPDGIVVVDRHGVVQFANAAAAELLGENADALQGQPFRFAVVGGRTDEVTLGERVAEMRTTETQWNGELAHLTALRDITKRKHAEEELRELYDRLEKVSMTKSRFIADTSHELRTPLNAMNNYAQLLDEGIYGPLNNRQRNAVRGIRECCARQMRTISDILDLAKIEAGQLEVRFETVALGPVCEEVLETSRALAAHSMISVELDLQAGLPSIRTDRARLKQVLLNLLGNAVKFTEQGRVRLSARIDSEPDYVALAVSDTGIGIAADDLTAIFEPYRQLASPTSPRYNGSGLGLDITRRLVELLGGWIDVESREGEGSTFTVLHPLRERAK